MTLTKTKLKRPAIEHRKRVGQHHHQGHHYMKPYWPYLPIVAILVFGFALNSWLTTIHRSVLGYATDMSVQSLLDDTNAQRASNGEGPLNVRSELNQAAQAKAADMAARDYWSHSTPDGQTPWTFITAAGYNFETAGENLAYGFGTAADTLTGWMNSPGHRANILNTSYRDIGFGIVDIPNYQGTGAETLVVAMYGSLPGEGPLPAPAPTVANNQPAPAPAPKPSPAPQPVAMPTPAPAPTATPTDTTVTKTDVVTPTGKPRSAATTPEQRVSRLQLVAKVSNTWSITMALVGIAAFALLVFRHGFAWRRVVVRSEQFVLHHPLLDIAAVSIATISLILSQTSGLIR
jgi:uncharacterized protein YkwD